MNDQQIIDALKAAVGTVPEHPARVELIRGRARRAKQRRVSEGLGCAALAVAVIAGTVAVDRATPQRVTLSDSPGPSAVKAALDKTEEAGSLAWRSVTTTTRRGPRTRLPSGFSEPRVASGRWDFARGVGRSQSDAGEQRFAGSSLYLHLNESDIRRLPAGSRARWQEVSDFEDGSAVLETQLAMPRAVVALFGRLRDGLKSATPIDPGQGAENGTTHFELSLPAETRRGLLAGMFPSAKSRAVVDVDRLGRIVRARLVTDYTYDDRLLKGLRDMYEKKSAETRRKLEEPLRHNRKEHPEQAAEMERLLEESLEVVDADTMMDMLLTRLEVEITLSGFGEPVVVDVPERDEIADMDTLRPIGGPRS